MTESKSVALPFGYIPIWKRLGIKGALKYVSSELLHVSCDVSQSQYSSSDTKSIKFPSAKPDGTYTRYPYSVYIHTSYCSAVNSSLAHSQEESQILNVFNVRGILRVQLCSEFFIQGTATPAIHMSAGTVLTRGRHSADVQIIFHTRHSFSICAFRFTNRCFGFLQRN